MLQELARELFPTALGRVAGDWGDPQRAEGATWAGPFGEDYVHLDPGRTRGELLRQVHAWQMMLDRSVVGPVATLDGRRLHVRARLSTSSTTRRSRVSRPPTAHCG